jgi:hypothetical protein
LRQTGKLWKSPIDEPKYGLVHKVNHVAQHRYATAWSAIAASWIDGTRRKTA